MGRTRRDLVLMSSFSHDFSLFLTLGYFSLYSSNQLPPTTISFLFLGPRNTRTHTHTDTHGEVPLIGNPVTSQVPAWTCRVGAWMRMGREGRKERRGGINMAVIIKFTTSHTDICPTFPWLM